MCTVHALHKLDRVQKAELGGQFHSSANKQGGSGQIQWLLNLMGRGHQLGFKQDPDRKFKVLFTSSKTSYI